MIEGQRKTDVPQILHTVAITRGLQKTFCKSDIYWKTGRDKRVKAAKVNV